MRALILPPGALAFPDFFDFLAKVALGIWEQQ